MTRVNMSGNKTSFSDFLKFDTLIFLFKFSENGNRQADVLDPHVDDLKRLHI